MVGYLGGIIYDVYVSYVHMSINNYDTRIVDYVVQQRMNDARSYACDAPTYDM